jgi:hypothetical protein
MPKPIVWAATANRGHPITSTIHHGCREGLHGEAVDRGAYRHERATEHGRTGRQPCRVSTRCVGEFVREFQQAADDQHDGDDDGEVDGAPRHVVRDRPKRRPGIRARHVGVKGIADEPKHRADDQDGAGGVPACSEGLHQRLRLVRLPNGAVTLE